MITFDNSIVKQVHCNPRDLNSIGRNIVYYIQGLEFEPLTSHFFTIKLSEFSNKKTSTLYAWETNLLTKNVVSFSLKKCSNFFVVKRHSHMKWIDWFVWGSPLSHEGEASFT